MSHPFLSLQKRQPNAVENEVSSSSSPPYQLPSSSLPSFTKSLGSFLKTRNPHVPKKELLNSLMSDFVSEDTVYQVFKWLPVQDLLRFRTVCKWWKQIIDSAPFILEHLSVQTPRLIAEYEVTDEFLVLDPNTLPSVEILSGPIGGPAVNSDFSLRLVGTLHGVVCIYDHDGNYLLWNPAVHRVLTIPGYQYVRFDWDDGEFINTYAGFWIDPSTKDFKILVFKLVLDNDELYDEEDTPDGILYSSKTREWTTLPLDEVGNCKPRHFQCAPAVMVGDLAYWRAEHVRIDKCGEQHSDLVLLSFDFGQERFYLARLSNENYSGHAQPIHCKMQGKLTLVYWDSDAPFRCDVCSRGESGTWDRVFGFRILPRSIFHVFWVLEGNEGRCKALALAPDNRVLFLYEPGVGSSVLDIELDDPGKMYLVYDFVESLLFPERKRGAVIG